MAAGSHARRFGRRKGEGGWNPTESGLSAVLKALAAVPDNRGLIASELAAVLGQDPRYVHAQIRRLRAAAAVVSTESIRVTNSHSSAKVWRASVTSVPCRTVGTIFDDLVNTVASE